MRFSQATGAFCFPAILTVSVMNLHQKHQANAEDSIEVKTSGP